MNLWKKILLISCGFLIETTSLALVVLVLHHYCPLVVWSAQTQLRPDEAIVINFNQPVLNFILGHDFVIDPPVPGKLTLEDFGRRLVFTPQIYLDGQQVYHIKLNNVWSFSLSHQSESNFEVFVKSPVALASLTPLALPKPGANNVLPRVGAANIATGCDPLGPPALVGKLIDVELSKKNIWLYEDGECIAKYEVHRYGSPSTPTPQGQFRVITKEPNHFSSSAHVWMPWSMNFHGDAFLHGIPYFPNGAILKGPYSHGCVQIPTDQAEKIYNFASIGTPVFVRW